MCFAIEFEEMDTQKAVELQKEKAMELQKQVELQVEDSDDEDCDFGDGLFGFADESSYSESDDDEGRDEEIERRQRERFERVVLAIPRDVERRQRNRTRAAARLVHGNIRTIRKIKTRNHHDDILKRSQKKIRAMDFVGKKFAWNSRPTRFNCTEERVFAMKKAVLRSPFMAMGVLVR